MVSTDLIDRLIVFIKTGLEEELALISSELLGGKVETMERYKFLMGKREGLVLAHRGVDAALKKMRNDDV
jgi:hypothetical protein